MCKTKIKVVLLLMNYSIFLVFVLEITESECVMFKSDMSHSKLFKVAPPKIFSEAEIILQVGNNLTVVCEGTKPLNWSWPEVNDKIYTIWTKIHVIKDIPKDKRFKYAERIFLQNVTYPFTGFYKCFDGNASDSIYLYVKDEKHLSVRGNYIIETVQADQFSKAVIPCRPTSPDVQVELRMYRPEAKEIILDEILEDDRIYHYHPHFGFFTNFTTTPEEVYQCTFIGNKSQTTNSIKVDIKPSFGMPVLKEISGGQTGVGQELVLECRFNERYSKGNFLTRLAWTTPNKKQLTYYHNFNYKDLRELGEDTRIVTSKRTVYPPKNFDVIKEHLIIKNATLKDSGVYYCSDEHNSNKSTSIDVTVYGPNDHFIDLTETNNMYQLFATTGEAFVQWTVKVKAHPKATLFWLDNKNEKIEKSDKYYTKLSYSTAILKIKNITLDDNGYYTLIAYNKLEEKSLVLLLNVIDKTFVDLEPQEKNPISDSRLTWLIWIIAVLLLSVIMLAVVQIVKMRKERKLQNELKKAGLKDFEEGALKNFNSALGIATQAEFLPYDKKWEFPLEKLKLNRQLGSGAYGVVIEADAEGIVKNGKTTKVAVKMLKKNVDHIHIKALVCELKILIHLGQHLNVVNLLGACTKDITKRELYIIVEYCRFGNLNNYLLTHRNYFKNQVDPGTDLLLDNDEIISSNNSHGDNHTTVSTKDLLIWAFQVSRGMEYLVSRRVLHGDLAARNILLANNNVIKICDFGLARHLCKSDNYKKKTEGPLPIKWLALETIADLVFSTQSDVWSFGIVLWEFFSLAKTPYPGIHICDLYIKLKEGYRMESPEYATKKIYEIMLACWEADPEMRPSFSKLTESIGSMLEDTVRSHYIDLNDPYLKMNTQRLEGGQTDYLSMLSPPLVEKFSSHSYEYISDLNSSDEDSSGYLKMVNQEEKKLNQSESIDDASGLSS